MKKNIYTILFIFLVRLSFGQDTLWTFLTGAEIKPSSPVIADDGSIYFGSYDNKIYGLNPDGSMKWAFETGARINTSPSLAVDGTVYCGSDDDSMYALNADGTLKWSFPTGGNIVYSTPAIANDGTIYFGSDDDKVYAVNPDGTLKWEFATGDNVRSSAAIGTDGTIYIASNDDNLYALNPDGTEQWNYNLGGNAEGAAAINSAGEIIIGVDLGGDQGRVVSLNPEGTAKWSVDVLGRISVNNIVLAEDGTIYTGTKEGHNLLAFNPADGSQVWEYVVDDASITNSSVAVGDDGLLYFGSWSDSLYCLNPDGTLNFTVNLNGDVWSSPTISNGILYVGSYDGRLYAIDVPSNELADSDWTKKGKDLRNTSNAYTTQLLINWAFQTGSDIKPSSPVIADDGSIYFGSYDNKIYGLNSDGTLKWAYETGARINTSPSLAVDGTVYCGSDDDSMYALYADGTLKWSFPTGGNIVYSTPAIANDGTIYFGSDDDKVFAVNPDGTLKWEFTTGDNVRSSAAIGTDGTIYIASNDDNLYALNPDGTEQWNYNLGGNAEGAAAINSAGEIIIGVDLGGDQGRVVSLNPDGTAKWSVDVLGRISVNNIVLAEDGTIYTGTKEGHNLLAFNPADGSQVWEYVVDDASITNSSVAVGDDGLLYFGSWDGYLHCLNPDGTLNFKVDLHGNVWSSPAIANGTLYVGSYDGNLYAIDVPSNQLADSDWPMKGLDLQHTSSVELSTSTSDLTYTSDEFKTYYHSGKINIQLKSYQGDARVVIYDMTGRVLSMHKVNLVDDNWQSFRFQPSVDGVYIVSIRTEENKFAARKINVFDAK